MANRYFEQSYHNLVKKLTKLVGKYTYTAGVAASLEVQDITYTADLLGVSGNLISITYTTGATAGSEVVTVVGNAITVQIEDGVSTATQVKAAVDTKAEAAALVNAVITGTAGTAQVAATEDFLVGGVDAYFTEVSGKGIASITQASGGTGVYVVNLNDQYSALEGFSATPITAAASDLGVQFISEDVASAKTINFRTVSSGSLANLVDGDGIFISIDLRNSSVN